MSAHPASISRKNSKWDWDNSKQSKKYFNHKVRTLYLVTLNNKSNWRRLVGLPFGLATGLLTITMQVSLIGECLIKALGNIFGSINPRSQFSAKTGCKQLGHYFTQTT